MTAQENILDRIMGKRRADVEAAKLATPLESLQAAAGARQHHSLIERLVRQDATQVIAEMKKASPSAGLLRETYEPGRIAASYEQAGAAGISVLTEPHHFQGSGEHVELARKQVALPILRKDFMCDPYQLYEAAAWGADVILLIVAALTDGELAELYRVSLGLGLEVLAESHNAAELERALQLEKAIIGVNSRNLKTLKTDLSTARELAAMIPVDRLSIAESGIKAPADIEDLEGHGYNGFLVGESLLKDGEPGNNLARLLRSAPGDGGTRR